MLISSQASIEEGSTTIPLGSTTQVSGKREALYSQSDEIVSTVWKHAAVCKKTAQTEQKQITCTVYGLYSSREPIVRYIGQTVQPLNRRYHQHLADAKRNDHKVHRWIRKEKRNGFKIHIQPIEKNCLLNIAETAWIAHYKRFTSNLTNTCAGGLCDHVGIKRSEETKAKMRKPKSKEHRKNMMGPRPEAVKRKMSLSQIGNTKSRGEANCHAKIKESDVKSIRRMIEANIPVREIALKYGVQKSAIWKIKTGRTWWYVK